MIIYGKNPVKELFSGPVRKIEELFVLEKSADSGSAGLVKLAKENGVKVSFLPRDGLTRIADSPNHQGLAARITDFQYSNVDDIMEAASEKGEKLLLIILDHIEDPQNLGAIIRTADVLGAHGAVIPKDRSASVTPAVLKASAGAAHHLPVSRVVNIASQIRHLKKKGVWIVGAEGEAGKNVFEEDFSTLDIALVIGNEGRGLSAKIREECDFLVAIPRKGGVSSLNASVAAGIMIYELMKQRGPG